MRITPLLVALAAIAYLISQPTTQRGTGPVSVPGSTISRFASDKPLPLYPEHSLRAGVGGIARAKVVFGLDGRVRDVSVLQSPDRDIATSVTSSLHDWRFPAGEVNGTLVESETELSFHFDPQDGGTVTALDAPKQQTAGTKELPGLRYISGASAEALAATNGAIVLDVRSRADFRRVARARAINIPLEELLARGKDELRSAVTVLVDCDQATALPCERAAVILQPLVGVDVLIWGMPSDGSRTTIAGTLARAIGLLERREYVTFFRELVSSDSISLLTRRMSLETYVHERAGAGAFDETLALLRSATKQEPKIFGDLAVFTFSPPVGTTERFSMTRIGPHWYLGI